MSTPPPAPPPARAVFYDPYQASGSGLNLRYQTPPPPSRGMGGRSFLSARSPSTQPKHAARVRTPGAGAAVLSSFKKIPDDVLREHLEPACTLTVLMNLRHCCRDLLRVLVAVPRQIVITARNNPLTVHPPTAPRWTDQPPCLAEYECQQTRMPDDAESMVIVELGPTSDAKVLELLSSKIDAFAVRLQVEAAQPIRIIQLTSESNRKHSLQQVMLLLPNEVRAQIHTLCVGLLPAPWWGTGQQRADDVPHFPFLTPPMDKVTTVKLFQSAVDLGQFSDVFPNISSLQLVECPLLTNVEAIADLQGLRDFKYSSKLEHPSFEVALSIISTAPPLTSISLRLLDRTSGQGDRAVEALSVLTGLKSLSLEFTNVYDMESFQDHLNELAANSPGVKHLVLILPGDEARVPVVWTQIEDLRVTHLMPVPDLPSMRTLVIERAINNYENRPLPYTPQEDPLPEFLEVLTCSYDALIHAVRCNNMQQITWTPCTRQQVGGHHFQQENHVALLVAVRSASIWSRLDRLLIQQDPAYHQKDDPSKEQREMQYIYNAQLLQSLASRANCVITQVSIDQSRLGTGAHEALCKMPLRTLTLINMEVNITQLNGFIRIPTLRLLELINIRGPTGVQLDNLKTSAVMVRRLADTEVNSGTSQTFRWPCCLGAT